MILSWGDHFGKRTVTINDLSKDKTDSIDAYLGICVHYGQYKTNDLWIENIYSFKICTKKPESTL